MKEFHAAIGDLNSAIDSGQYPAENLFKLYQRLAKAQESLQNYDFAASSYGKVIESTDLSKMPNHQKLQINNEARKCMILCRKRITANSFTSIAPNMSQGMSCQAITGTKHDFPMYKAAHPQIKNASGSLYFSVRHN